MTTHWWKEPTRAQWSAFTAAWLGWVLDAFDFTIYFLVMQDIAKEFDVGLTAVAGSLTLTLLVRLVGGVVAGSMADRWGRKLPLMLSLLWFAVFDAAVYFAPSFAWILVFRTLFGFGMGAEWTAGTTLAMESWPVSSRKIASGILQGSWAVGFLLAAVTAWFFVPRYGWRILFLIAAAPALLTVPIRYLVPESPEWTKGQAKGKPKTSFRDLLAPGLGGLLVLGSLVMALGFAVYYGMTALYSTMLVRELGLTPRDAFVHTIIFNLGMMTGAIACGVLANRRGVIFAIVVPAALMVPALPLFVGAVPGLLGVGAFLGGALGVGYSGVTPALLTNLFPAHVRARALGIVYHAGALLAAFVPMGLPWLAERTGMGLATSIGLVSGTALLALIGGIWLLRHRVAPDEATSIAATTATDDPAEAVA